MKKISAAILLIIFLGLTSCHEDPQTISENPKTASENYQRKMSKDEMEMTVDPFNDKDKNYTIVYEEIKDYEKELSFLTATVTTYNFTHVRVYEFPNIKDVTQKTAVITLIDKSYLLFYKEEKNTLTVTNKKGIKIFTADLKSQGKNYIDSGLVYDLQNTFVGIPYSKCDCHGEESSCNHKFDRMENCAKYKFSKCYACGNDVCTQDNRCDIARSLTGPAWTLGLIAACSVAQL